MRPVSIGASGRFEIVPDHSHTAAAIGNAGVAVVATPALVGFLEQASHLAVRSAFDPGEASVGTRLEIEHLAPAFPGRRVCAAATVTAVERRNIRFEVGVEQDGRTIMCGRHDRFVIDLARFLAKRPAPAAAATAHPAAYDVLRRTAAVGDAGAGSARGRLATLTALLGSPRPSTRSASCVAPGCRDGAPPGARSLSRSDLKAKRCRVRLRLSRRTLRNSSSRRRGSPPSLHTIRAGQVASAFHGETEGPIR